MSDLHAVQQHLSNEWQINVYTGQSPAVASYGPNGALHHLNILIKEDIGEQCSVEGPLVGEPTGHAVLINSIAGFMGVRK